MDRRETLADFACPEESWQKQLSIVLREKIGNTI
jgi:hypothetical protein